MKRRMVILFMLVLCLVLVVNPSLVALANSVEQVNEIEANSRVSTEEYINYLQKNNIPFEVKTTYYEKIGTNTFNATDKIVEINENKFLKVDETTSYNALPITTRSYSEGDTRVSEVTVMTASELFIDRVDGLYEALFGVTITTVLGYFHAVVPLILAVPQVGSWNMPVSLWGRTKNHTENDYFKTSVFHDVYGSFGFDTYVITEMRKKNMTFFTKVIKKGTTETHSGAESYNAILYEYSDQFGKLTQNLAEAVDRYYRGFGLKVYEFDTGLVIDNSGILPD